MHNYLFSTDKLSKIITWIVVAVMILPSAIGYSAFLRSGKDPAALIGIFAGPVILFILTITMYLLMPVSAEITGTGITIHRRINPPTFLFTDIKSISIPDPEDMKGVLRTFGNGGLFGYTGKYWNKKMGSMSWYCTQRRNYIIIDMQNNNRIVITPDDPEGFMKDLPLEFRSRG